MRILPPSILFATLVIACRNPSAASNVPAASRSDRLEADAASSRPEAESTASRLTEHIEGFAAGPLVREHGFERRTYSRNEARVTVTLATFPMSDEGYAEWLRQSEGSYAQATLDVPPGRGNGFYQCAEQGIDAHCSLLVQLRSGVHLEIRGEGTTTRADVDAVARGLPLRALAGDAAPGPGPSAFGSSGSSRLVSFTRDVLPVLVRECASTTGCHGDQRTGRTDLDLRAAFAHRTLVGRASRERRDALLVAPGDVAHSFLVDKLTLDAFARGEGRRMPLDVETGLARDDHPLVDWTSRALVPWIEQGAREN